MATELEFVRLGELDCPHLPEWAQALAATVDVAALIDLVVARDVEMAFPDHLHDDEFIRHLRASVAENVIALQNVLAGRLAFSQVRPAEPLAFGAVQAELRIPQTTLQRSYRVGFFEIWTVWSRALAEYAERADIPRAQAVETLHRLTATILAYQDLVGSQVADNYRRAEESLQRSHDAARQRVVADLIGGGWRDIHPADRLVMDYDLDADHLAMLLPATGRAAAAVLAQELRVATGASATLVHPRSLGSSIIWLGRSTGWSDRDVEVACALLADRAMAADVATSSRGVEGLRAGLVQAVEVESVRQALGATAPLVIRHADVSLEIILSSAPPERARVFVEQVLGPLAASSPTIDVLCDTVQASLRWGGPTAAAVYLGLHEHTVRNRMKRAEALIGRSVAGRRPELEAALRLRLMLRTDQRGPLPRISRAARS